MQTSQEFQSRAQKYIEARIKLAEKNQLQELYSFNFPGRQTVPVIARWLLWVIEKFYGMQVGTQVIDLKPSAPN